MSTDERGTFLSGTGWIERSVPRRKPCPRRENPGTGDAVIGCPDCGGPNVPGGHWVYVDTRGTGRIYVEPTTRKLELVTDTDELEPRPKVCNGVAHFELEP